MRGVISGLVAIAGLAIAGSAPAMACGASPCAPCGYASPCAPTVTYQPAYTYQPGYTYGHAGCGSCGAQYERLPEPTRQYYYVNQGPTYTGPGAFAPYPVYEERAIPVYRYHHRRHAYEVTRVAPPMAYGHAQAYRWGASPYYHGRRVLRRYY
ncbi:hypothetical protein ACQR16_01835 [Bradyrhizobium oligotrophicum]|uniref:hypothetical protein n=1 Tax=Bradyrhizobium oligotrophicum TaxID=44255 RepID=UPI003EB7E13E